MNVQTKYVFSDSLLQFTQSSKSFGLLQEHYLEISLLKTQDEIPRYELNNYSLLSAEL